MKLSPAQQAQVRQLMQQSQAGVTASALRKRAKPARPGDPPLGGLKRRTCLNAHACCA